MQGDDLAMSAAFAIALAFGGARFRSEGPYLHRLESLSVRDIAIVGGAVPAGIFLALAVLRGSKITRIQGR